MALLDHPDFGEALPDGRCGAVLRRVVENDDLHVGPFERLEAGEQELP
jgi:hypothetical protein